MDIVICAAGDLEVINETSNTIGNWLRYRQIKSFYSALDDVYEFQRTQPEVNYRYLAVPSVNLLKNPLDEVIFNNKTIPPMIATGQADAAALIA